MSNTDTTMIFEELDDGTLEAKIIKGEEEISIPGYSEGRKVTSVDLDGDEALDVAKIKRVILPPGIREIAYGAFSGCASLEEINFPEGLRSIGDSAFYGCHSLKRVFLPSTLEVVGDIIFGDCPSLEEISVSEDNSVFSSLDGSLYSKDKSKLILYAAGKENDELRLPDSTVEISESAFAGVRSLRKIIIGKNLTKIGRNAFPRCCSLEEILVDEGNEVFASEDGSLYNKDKTVLIQYAIGKSDITLDIPKTVRLIDDSACLGAKNLVEVILPPSLREISHYAFFGCEALSKIHGGKGLTYIGECAFDGCDSLIEIKIPRTVDFISDFAFSGCDSLTVVTEFEKLPPDWYYGIEDDVMDIVYGSDI